MSSGIFAIKPGPSQQLQGANYSNGAVFYNPDPNNGVWVSSRQSVTPNNGAWLPPLGTVVWSSQSGTPWAVVDTGVSSVVNILVTDDVTDISDPVAIGAAIAAKLLVTGVPNVLTETTVASAISLIHGAANNYNIGGFASLEISCQAVTTQQQLLFEQFANGVLVASDTLYFQPAIIQPIILQCVGDTLTVTNQSGANSVNLTIIGTNRQPVIRLDARSQYVNGLIATATVATVAGNDYPLLTSGAGIQGTMFASIGAGGATSTGQFVIKTATGDDLYIADTTEMYAQSGGGARRIHRMIAIPPDFTGFEYHCRGAGDAVARTFNIFLVPAEL